MDNNQVNAKELFDVSSEILSIIDEIYLELNELDLKREKAIFSCQELKRMDSSRVVSTSDFSSNGEMIATDWRRCQIYGEIEVEESLLQLKGKIDAISEAMDAIYNKVKLSREISDGIERKVQSIEDVLAGSVGFGATNKFVDQGTPVMNNNFVNEDQVKSSIDVNLEQNRILTNQVSNEIYRGMYDKFQEMISNSGDKL